MRRIRLNFSINDSLRSAINMSYFCCAFFKLRQNDYYYDYYYTKSSPRKVYNNDKSSPRKMWFHTESSPRKMYCKRKTC